MEGTEVEVIDIWTLQLIIKWDHCRRHNHHHHHRRCCCCCCVVLCLLSQAFSSRYFSWTSGDPHHSGFKLHTAVLYVLCVMNQVHLSFVMDLLNVFLLWLPNMSLKLLLLLVAVAVAAAAVVVEAVVVKCSCATGSRCSEQNLYAMSHSLFRWGFALPYG